MRVPLQVVDHPLVHDALIELRDKTTPPPAFRRAANRISVLLAAEALKEVPSVATTVETPLGPAAGRAVQGDVVVVPVLRAGLGMLDAVLELLPGARVGHIGLQRDEATAIASKYYSKLPPERPVDIGLILDPMLATGGSAVDALTTLREWGVPHVKLLSLIASEEGVKRVECEFPTSQIYVCQVDPDLNDRKFIVPGLGDAGDRIFNTIHDA